MSRTVLMLAALLAVSACGGGPRNPGARVVVLGFDGLDYGVTRELMAQGRLPNFSRLAASGTFAPLGTSIPPQSPVAWSTFITGLDPGQHGIFDFVHRDPATMLPYLSTSRTEPPGLSVRFGKWQFPIKPGRIELLRRGRPFWEALEAHGIETTIVRMPANFPPSGTATRELSGMGTPDILGTYGTFSFFTSSPDASTDRSLSGGVVFAVDASNGVVHGVLEGPDNPFLIEPEKAQKPFDLYISGDRRYAKLVIGPEERLLKAREWSDWVPVRFDLLAGQHVDAAARFFVKQLDPDVELYVSPLNLDPLSPALPISTPDSYAGELARAAGRFYTQGMPEDTASLKAGILSRAEFLEQARIAGDEVKRQYRYALERFQDGLLFYYFGNVDQISHMMWRARDADHPAYDPHRDPQFEQVIADLYVGLDAVVGETLARLGRDDLLVVMSDHGFTSWRRSFHLNSWLRDNGYLVVDHEALPAGEETGSFDGVNWGRTRAYALGLNGLYVNLRGREARGVVAREERSALLAEITAKLLQTTDPKTGRPAVTRVFRSDQVFQVEGNEAVAPDLIIGYAKGTRSSDESALGGLPMEIFADNDSPWSGDHCMDPSTVPGILLSSRPLRKAAPDLQSLAGAVLAEFGIDDFPSAR
jgi:predicted AlkP superfamily phosphohydrolase/phosphomutase